MDVVGKIRMLDGLVYTYWLIQVQYSKLDGTVSHSVITVQELSQ